MTEIKFVRVERDCPANVNARTEAEKKGHTPVLIYDYNVLIDGEHRAIMVRRCYGVGYELEDADRRAINMTEDHYWRRRDLVASKGMFEPTIEKYLAAGKIPTLGQMADMRKQEERAKAAKKREVLAKRRRYAIEQHAEAIFEALTKPEKRAKVLATVEAAIAKALATSENDID